MKILFVHHGTFAANSMNHIGPFANELKKQGHEIVVTLPELDPTFKVFPYPLVPAFAYDEILENPYRFEGEGPDIVHAWTPREVVRQFCEKLWERIEARFLIHLEDDEGAIQEQFPGGDTQISSRTSPLHGRRFLESADAFTVIIESLLDSVPANKPSHCLLPGFDKLAAENNREPPYTKSDFGIPEDYHLITYPGGASGPNSQDLADLFEAVHLLNEYGTPCLLLKTGFPDPLIRNALPKGAENWIRDLGYLSRDQVWRLVELADITVQPGRINDYNEKRLPSKLLDFFCFAKPVITSAANLGHRIEDGRQALLLKTSNAEEIAARCQELFSNPELASKIALEGQKAGQSWFDLTHNIIGLLLFYEEILKSPSEQLRHPAGDQINSAIDSLEEELGRIVPPSDEALSTRAYLKAVRDEVKESEQTESISTPVPIELQVFYPNHSSKLELSSLRRWYARGDPHTGTFPFSPPQTLDWIRIDPGQYPGTYVLKSWAVLDAIQNVLYEWTPKQNLTNYCQLNGATAGPVTPRGQEIWCLTHDPQLLFAPLPEVDTEKVRWFKIEFSADEVESPRTKKLKLRSRPVSEKKPDSEIQIEKIDQLLKTLERRRSPVLRLIDRIQKKIKG